MGKSKYNAGWAEAKKKCRLNQADIQMAKELGMKPKSLMKNIPSPQQQWKAPVKIWVRNLYEDKFGKVIDNNNKQQPKKATQSETSKPDKHGNDGQDYIPEEELPF